MSEFATRRPLVPEDLHRTDPLRNYFRAATAIAVAATRGGGVHADAVVKEFWGRERDVEAITRAAVSPASTTGTGWANTFATTGAGAARHDHDDEPGGRERVRVGKSAATPARAFLPVREHG